MSVLSQLLIEVKYCRRPSLDMLSFEMYVSYEFDTIYVYKLLLKVNSMFEYLHILLVGE